VALRIHLLAELLHPRVRGNGVAALARLTRLGHRLAELIARAARPLALAKRLDLLLLLLGERDALEQHLIWAAAATAALDLTRAVARRTGLGGLRRCRTRDTKRERQTERRNGRLLHRLLQWCGLTASTRPRAPAHHSCFEA